MMKRNKKFYENKRLRRLWREYCRLGNFRRYAIFSDSNTGRWNGHEFFLSIKKEARKHAFCKDLRIVINICGKTEKQIPGCRFLYNSEKFTDDSCKTFKGSIQSLLKVYPNTEIFQKKVPRQLRYLFDHDIDYSMHSLYDGEVFRKIDYTLSNKYIPYLEVHRRRAWESMCESLEDPELGRLREKIQRDNLWPKIEKALNSRYNSPWDKVHNEYTQKRKDRIALKEMKLDIEETKELSPLELHNDRPLEYALLLSGRGIFKTRNKFRWGHYQDY